MWRLRIEQYFQIQDYALWDVIENGNSFKPLAKTTKNDAGTSTTRILGPITNEEKAQKKNDVKGRSMLLMALPNENLMTFNQYKDAKTLFATIETRFGGNKPPRRLKRLFSSNYMKTLEDLNLIFLRSLPSKWNTHVVVWRNKLDLDTMSLDDLYNNFKIVEQEANQPNGSKLMREDLEQIHEDVLEEMDLKWQLALLSMRAKRFFQKTGKKITINGSDTAGYDKSKENRTRNQETTRKTVNVEDTSSKVMVEIDGAGFDWSYMGADKAPTNMAFMAFSDSEVYTDNTCSKACLKNYATLKTQYDELRVEFNKSKYSEIAVLKSKLEKISKENDVLETKIKIFEFASQSLDKLIGSQITDNSKRGLGYVSYNVVSPSHTGRFLPLRIDLSHTGLPEFAELKNNSVPIIKDWESKGEDEVESPSKVERKTIKPNVDKVEVDIPKQNDKPARRPVKYAEMYRTQRPRRNQRNWNNLKSHQLEGRMVNGTNHSRVNHFANTVLKALLTRTGLKPVNYVRHVNPKRPNSTILNAVRANKGKAGHSHRQLEDQGYFDSRCSRYMTRYISYLTDFKELDGGVLVVKPHFKTPYELFRGRTHALSFMRPFGCHVTIVNTLDHLEKFDGEIDEWFFVGYSTNSKAFRVYNTITRKIEENLHIKFLENKPLIAASLKKPQGSEDFQQIIDFLNASHIRYALTKNPTIYVSLINQFWCTASVRTLDNGEIELNAIVDDHVKTITEASVRRDLKLADANGISTLPTTKIFEQFSLMGGEGPTSPVGTQHTPTIIKTSPQLQNISITFRKTKTKTKRKGIRIPQSNVPTSVADEAITKEMHDGLGRATTTASSLEAEQGSGKISKTMVKDNKEKDKIKEKPDKIKSKREARKSLDSSSTKLKPVKAKKASNFDSIIETPPRWETTRRNEEEKQIKEEQAAKAQNWKLSVCYDDDDDDDEERSISLKDNIIFGLPPCAAITPSLPTEEPDNSLSMGDEHLDTILAMESDEFIKYSVDSLVPILNQFEDFSNSNDESTTYDDDSFSIDNIEYAEASPPDSELISLEVMEIVIPEVGGIDDDILLTIKDDILREKLLNINLLIANIEALNNNPTPSSDFMTKSDFYEFIDELTHIISPPEYDCFCFKIEPNLGESLLAYVVWIFISFLSYSVAPQYLLSLGNEDTIFDPGICSYHISSFLPDVSHRIPGNVKTHAKGICTPVFISSASIGNH
nr:retrovirus-related Pol polyprotein from transposon TNT 1-94 [Tanacetum cinerariifolium]